MKQAAINFSSSFRGRRTRNPAAAGSLVALLLEMTKRCKFFTFLFLFALCVLIQIPTASAMGRKPSSFPVHMKVDFGPAGKPVHEETLEVEKGTTPKEAVSQVFPVLSGKTCCSPREIMGIGGVNVDPAKNRWWTCAVNGSKKISPQKKKLKSGDRVEWKYIEDAQ